MKKFIVLAALLLILGTTKTFADTELEIGEQIYQRAFGRGCGTCHDNSSNPKLTTLIHTGVIDITSFSDILKNGKNGMQKNTMPTIMLVGAVKNAGYSEEQAINAIYRYLSEQNKNNISLLSDVEKNHSIILNEDFSFSLPVVRLAPPDNRLYAVEFIFKPGHPNLFEPVEINQCFLGRYGISGDSPQCREASLSDMAIYLNEDFSFNIPLIRYIDPRGIEHYYNVKFLLTLINNKMLFAPVKVIELQ